MSKWWKVFLVCLIALLAAPAILHLVIVGLIAAKTALLPSPDPPKIEGSIAPSPGDAAGEGGVSTPAR